MASITKAFTFVTNTIAEASEVNSNFDPIYTTLNSAVNSENLAPSGVTAPRIGDTAILTRHLGASAVTGAKVASDTLPGRTLDYSAYLAMEVFS